MANRYMERILNIARHQENANQSQDGGYHPKDKKLQMLVRKGIEKRKRWALLAGSNLMQPLWKTGWRPQNIKTPQEYSNCTFGCLSEGSRDVDWKRSLHPPVPCSIADDSQDLETV